MRQHTEWEKEFLREEWVWGMKSDQEHGLTGKVTLKLSSSPALSGSVLSPQEDRGGGSLEQLCGQSSSCVRPRTASSIIHECPQLSAGGQDLAFYL